MKIGVIGTGTIAASFMQAARLVEDIEFTAVYSRTLEKGELFAKANHIENVYTDLSTFFNDESLDTIYIASPNSLHYAQAKQAMLAGKHVLLEKPFTGNVRRAKELINIAKKQNVFLFEAICNIHMPHFKYIKNRLTELGPLKIVQCNYSQYSSRYDALLNGHVENVFNPDFSGGALADLNIYNLHFAVGLFGKPKGIHYYANTHENGIDISGILILDYGAFKASLIGAKDSFSYNIAQIQGENGYVMIPGGTNGLESISITTHENKKEILEQDKPRLYYQVEVFKKMVDEKNYSLRDVYLDHSLEVVKVAVEARRQIGLDFDY